MERGRTKKINTCTWRSYDVVHKPTDPNDGTRTMDWDDEREEGLDEGSGEG